MKSVVLVVVEALTGLAVVASLLLLTIEVDANTRAVRHQIESERIDRIRSASDSEFIPPIVDKIKQKDVEYIEPATQRFMSVYGLEFEEADRFSRHLASIWEGIQADWRFGFGDERYVSTLLKYPDQQEFWVASAEQFDNCFVAWVEAIRSGDMPVPGLPQENAWDKFRSIIIQSGDDQSIFNNCGEQKIAPVSVS